MHWTVRSSNKDRTTLPLMKTMNRGMESVRPATPRPITIPMMPPLTTSMKQEVDCVTCHSHQAGFAASGGDCIGCHSNAQGSRRAAAAEFPADNAHAHYGSALDEASCLVCHSVGTHMDGYVELIDPDDGSIYRFVLAEDLTSDPDLSRFLCQLPR